METTYGYASLAPGSGLYFRKLGPRTPVGLCQLPLSLIVTIIGMMTPFAWPTLLASPLYLAGLALHLILFVACFLTPGSACAIARI